MTSKAVDDAADASQRLANKVADEAEDSLRFAVRAANAASSQMAVDLAIVTSKAVDDAADASETLAKTVATAAQETTNLAVRAANVASSKVAEDLAVVTSKALDDTISSGKMALVRAVSAADLRSSETERLVAEETLVAAAKVAQESQLFVAKAVKDANARYEHRPGTGRCDSSGRSHCEGGGASQLRIQQARRRYEDFT